MPTNSTYVDLSNQDQSKQPMLKEIRSKSDEWLAISHKLGLLKYVILRKGVREVP